jgi:cytidylate kinase
VLLFFLRKKVGQKRIIYQKQNLIIIGGRDLMKEVIRDKKIEFRLTAEEKEKIIAYAEKHDMNMSEVIRSLCEKIFYESEAET